jgi:hypothetical protein
LDADSKSAQVPANAIMVPVSVARETRSPKINLSRTTQIGTVAITSAANQEGMPRDCANETPPLPSVSIKTPRLTVWKIAWRGISNERQPERQAMKLAKIKLAVKNRMNTDVKGGKPLTAFSIPKKLLPQQM